MPDVPNNHSDGVRVLILHKQATVRTNLSQVFRQFEKITQIYVAPDYHIALPRIESGDVELIVINETDIESFRRNVHTDAKMIVVRDAPQDRQVSVRRQGRAITLPNPWSRDAEEQLYQLLEPMVRVAATHRVATNVMHYSKRIAQIARRMEQHATRPIVHRPPRAKPDAPLPPYQFGVVAIGISTGGPQALMKMVPQLPPDLPVPILVVQHMPPIFTEALAQDLNKRSPIQVVEAQARMPVKPGVMYLAPGGYHMLVRRMGADAVVELNEGPSENGCRPAADVLFRSIADCYPRVPVLAVIMTGMGRDGMKGVQMLKQQRCYCLSQTPESCVVYGMPMEVDAAGLTDESVALDDLAPRITRLLRH